MSWLGLKTHQLEALQKMHNGCILCGGYGSGKSRTALAYYYIQNGGDVRTKTYSVMGLPFVDDTITKGKTLEIQDLYIITTARKRDTHEWEAEMSHFLISPDPEADMYSHKVVVDSWNNIKKYIGVKDAFFIFDEQRVVGYGEWTKSFLKITKQNEWILLSATPGDCWSDYIPVFIANGFYKNKTQFNNEHVIFKRFTNFPQIDRYIGLSRLTRLRNRVLVDMDFNRLTVPHHIDVNCGYNKENYRRLWKERWNYWEDEPIENASQFCYLCRKVVNSDESRQVAVLEILEKHPKAIIFYNFDFELDILRNILADYPMAEWNGHKHQEMPTGDRWVYLVHYLAGAEGWNCFTTDTIIFFSQTYSYKTLVQACGRIDRMNTPYTDLYYYHLKSNASIDVAIARALKNKKDFNKRRFYDGK